ncbi:hypothetical protein SPI02_10600 [Staphylococcus piscifermentans]|uniref:Uncharacterized protein n=1 Tax=Staphylococcus piscifermentans TaxID=70258 RepID=A0A512QM01_9STAP|nr:hypothetical protein SPI02_10600 [Staphylococcus piscifermentans]
MVECEKDGGPLYVVFQYGDEHFVVIVPFNELMNDEIVHDSGK